MTHACAICGDEVDIVVERPLGKADALVKVCLECDDGPVVTKMGPTLSYEPPDVDISVGWRERAVVKKKLRR